VRVERELASRARVHLGGSLAFCLYDRFRDLVLTIDDGIASEIIAGRLQIDFTPMPEEPRVAPIARAVAHLAERRRQVRRRLRANATLYHAFQLLRGRRFTREEILRIQAEEFMEFPAGQQPPSSGPVPISRIAHSEARLDTETVLVSGGLDWEFKNIRALGRLKQEHRFRYCTIVHDIIPVLFPHFVVPSLLNALTGYFRDLVYVADHAMCNSCATERDWLWHCRELGITTMRSDVFPLGSDLPKGDAAALPELPESLSGKRFALFVSTIEPRKNHRTLYDAWDHCVRAGMVDPERDRLVFVGRQGWATGDLLHEIATNPAMEHTLIVLNHVSDGMLRSLYQRCSLVLFPSFYEGYGLPVAEALGYAKPCITSDAGSLPEIGGELVLRIDPKDTLAWAEAVARYMAALDECDAWSRRIKAAYRPVTWDDTAQKFFGAVTKLGS
jgi:glycosyltransferase involved in cell wall biosynthesis